jgi:hypothetical protein
MLALEMKVVQFLAVIIVSFAGFEGHYSIRVTTSVNNALGFFA